MAQRRQKNTLKTLKENGSRGDDDDDDGVLFGIGDRFRSRVNVIKIDESKKDRAIPKLRTSASSNGPLQ